MVAQKKNPLLNEEQRIYCIVLEIFNFHLRKN